ncbi:MAG: DUF378 domain-containing protein [Epulopiscium sp.]|jgi:uncharacterized membrane protein YuzA (DUF378 family)|nr:DUF378 domain-containing protein [Candidatus Epulonipiscium sp.]
MKALNWIGLTIVILGALNWGLIGFFGFDVITTIFHGSYFWIARVIFALVGVAGLYALTFYGNFFETDELNYARYSRRH